MPRQPTQHTSTEAPSRICTTEESIPVSGKWTERIGFCGSCRVSCTATAVQVNRSRMEPKFGSRHKPERMTLREKPSLFMGAPLAPTLREEARPRVVWLLGQGWCQYGIKSVHPSSH